MAQYNGFRFAELGPMERLTSPDTCDCCGREGLKRTVKLISPAGRPVWYGTGCAARAMGCPTKTVTKARKAAHDAAYAAERKQKAAESRAREAAWQAFLDANAVGVAPGAGNRFEQIQSLGGYAAAKAMYRKAA